MSTSWGRRCSSNKNSNVTNVTHVSSLGMKLISVFLLSALFRGGEGVHQRPKPKEGKIDWGLKQQAIQVAISFSKGTD